MVNKPVKDVVVDTNVIKLYNNPGDPLIRAFFLWIRDHGTLTISQNYSSSMEALVIET
jgi:hypothetical protein